MPAGAEDHVVFLWRSLRSNPATYLLQGEVRPDMGALATDSVVLGAHDTVLTRAAAFGSFHVNAIDTRRGDLKWPGRAAGREGKRREIC